MYTPDESLQKMYAIVAPEFQTNAIVILIQFRVLGSLYNTMRDMRRAVIFTKRTLDAPIDYSEFCY